MRRYLIKPLHFPGSCGKVMQTIIKRQEEADLSVRWKRLLGLAVTGLWVWFIFARSARTAEESSAESAMILELLRKLIPFLTDTVLRKLAHFTEYFILGGLLYMDWRIWNRGSVLAVLSLAAGIACVDELIIQANTAGRSGELWDILLDTAGAAAAVGILLLLRRRKERRAHGDGRKEI